MNDNAGGGSAALIHLSCFGGFRVTAETPLGPTFLQPSGVAMLAILAAVGDAGITSEELRELAWGELSDAEGRAAVAQALTSLWRGGNGDSLLAAGDRVALNGDRVGTDVASFVAAWARGDATAATAIYEGPYLDGVTLDVGPRFNHWLDETRERFNSQYQELARAARRPARAAAEQAAPDWNAPIAVSAVASVAPAMVDSEPAMFATEPEAPRRNRYLWLGGAAIGCALLAWMLTRRPSDEGEGAVALRQGDYAAARAAFARGIAADSSDSWLWFQLARAADAGGDDAAADLAAKRADSLREPLPRARAALVHGYRLWRNGNTVRALGVLDSLAQQQPKFVEAAEVLGEVEYRSAPLIGQSRVSARSSLNHTVELQPSAGLSWRRLLSLALVHHDTALGERALSGLLGAMGPRADTAYGWLRSTWSADTTSLQQLLARAQNTTAADLLEQAQLLGFDAGRTTEALVLTEPLLAERNSLSDRITARVIRAALFGAVDDWSRVDSEAVQLSRDWPWGALMLEAAAVLAPTRSVRPTEVRSLRDRVMRMTPDTGAAAVRHPLLPSASRTVRLYLLGELSYRMNDLRGVQAAVDSLSSPKLGELSLPRTGGSYALALQALQFLARGDSAAALGRLEQATGPVPVGSQQQLWVNGSLERRRRAGLLLALGRPGEAAGWLAGAGEFLADLLLGPPLR